jgi:hypothetical protein
MRGHPENASRVYYQLTNGDYFRETTLNSWGDVVSVTYEYSTDLKNWYRIRLEDFETDCLSCSLERIAFEVEKAGARYLLPLEDMYILFEGEDFDGNEASRVAAGGFLVLEVVQARKFLRFVKAARILSRTGGEVNTVRRVIWTGAKSISRDAAIDMSAQFVVNFVTTAINNPNADGQDIALKAFADINVGNAVWSGVINYTSLSQKEQFAFDCAYRVLRNLEDYGDSTNSLTKGLVDCAYLAGIRYTLKYLRNTDIAKQLARDIADSRQYDIVMQKLATIMNADQLQNFVEALAENGIQKGMEPVWAR